MPGTYLKLPAVEVVTVLEQELVGGLETGLRAVPYNCTGTRRMTDLLHLKSQTNTVSTGKSIMYLSAQR